MIYLLEDDNSIRDFVTYTLNGQGMPAQGFALPSEFWRAVEETVPTLVLLDIMLPEEDGITVLKKLRETPRTAEVPVIMLKEDFERLVVAEQEKQLGKNKNSEAWHRAERTKAFYEYWDLSSCRTENAKTALLKRYPVTECCVIYALDATATDEEKEFILGQLRSIGFSQLDLIEAYENLYRAVEESDSPNKETILATLPDIPPRPASEEE